MSAMIQVRNVPEPLHRILKSRAALEGLSLSDFCLAELRRAAERPSLAEMRERLARFPALDADVGAASLVRAERDAR